MFYILFLFIYSDETADVVNDVKGTRRSSGIATISMLSSTRSMTALNRWRMRGGKSKSKSSKIPGTAPRLSCDSQQQDTHNEITYVPTSALKSAMAEERKNGTLEEESCRNECDEEDKVSIRTYMTWGFKLIHILYASPYVIFA